tara:strand:- start:3061 stop:3168 length:108 start_codon:yes stop_codon:yes gene_type:complete
MQPITNISVRFEESTFLTYIGLYQNEDAMADLFSE